MPLTRDLAARFAGIALGHVTREYPHALTHVLDGPPDVRSPRDLHPVFYGSFDWHSCVHAYWMLARLLFLFPAMPQAAAIRALFDSHLTAEAVAGECAYLDRPAARGFERPYGWAWLLELSAAMRVFPDRPWSATLAPLTAIFAARFEDFLPKAVYPVRAGTHFNTAFALALADDHPPLRDLLRQTAERWYGADTNCPGWEPSGDDFLSPALMEAECMRRLLPAERFLPWLDRFLPDIADGRPTALFRPAAVTDRSDGKIAHLDGLNLSRAWCWRSLAAALPPDDPRRPVMLRAAELHLDAALPHLADDYMGEHWLASFAVLALDV
nr:DUF2891 domain-containing protein [uncultured Rhodopila sp.]